MVRAEAQSVSIRAGLKIKSDGNCIVMRNMMSKAAPALFAGAAATAIAFAPAAFGSTGAFSLNPPPPPPCANADGSPCFIGSNGVAGPGGAAGAVPGGPGGAAGPEGATGVIPGGPGGTAGPDGASGAIPGGPGGAAGPEGATGSIPGGPAGTAGPDGVSGSIPGGPSGSAGPGGVQGCIPGVGCIG